MFEKGDKVYVFKKVPGQFAPMRYLTRVIEEHSKNILVETPYGSQWYPKKRVLKYREPASPDSNNNNVQKPA